MWFPLCPVSLSSAGPSLWASAPPATLWCSFRRGGGTSQVGFDSLSCCSSENRIRVLCEMEGGGGGSDAWLCRDAEECNVLLCQQRCKECVWKETLFGENIRRLLNNWLKLMGDRLRPRWEPSRTESGNQHQLFPPATADRVSYVHLEPKVTQPRQQQRIRSVKFFISFHSRCSIVSDAWMTPQTKHYTTT